MSSYFEEGKVTQAVYAKRLENKQAELLLYGEGTGYQNSLKMSYMEQVRAFIEHAEYEVSQGRTVENDCNRVVLLAPNAFLARQAYLALLRGMEDISVKAQEDDGYDYGMVLRTHIPEKRRMKGEVLALRCEESKQESAIESRGRFVFPGFVQVSVEEANYDEPQDVKKLLLEYGDVKNPDKLVEEILDREQKQIAVYLKSSGSYEYVLKRLAFEGDYKVLWIGTPSDADYVKYAEAYIACHGFAVASDVKLVEVIRELKRYRGSHMGEKDIYIHLSRSFVKAKKEHRKTLSCEDLQVSYYGKTALGQKAFSEVIGLEEVKENLNRMMAAEKVLNNCQEKMYRHMIFAGSPGTGKSMMARLLAKCMGELGLSNGCFVDVCRADVIGKYVGHTADRIREAFQKAEGGVLFVDEASFLLSDDPYVKEAVIEFVRYMELYPQTTVIFAGYPKEMEALRNCDSGFASRIKRVVAFDGYENEQLFTILQSMAKKYEFTITEDSKKLVFDYIEQIRRRKGFGQAREMRKLLETAIEEYGLLYEVGKDRLLTFQEIDRAIKRLLEAGTPTAGIGFLPSMM